MSINTEKYNFLNDIRDSVNIGIQAHIDWLSVTTFDKWVYQEWALAFRDYLMQLYPDLKMASSIVDTWGWRGYKGYSAEGIRVGTNGNGHSIAVLSGDSSAEIWRKFMPGRGRVTRIDLAVTVSLGARSEGISSMSFDVLEDVGSKRKYSLVKNSQGGQTLYLGSRTSETYCRLYDKGSERGDEPGWVWRYEVEYKKPKSEKVASVLESVSDQERSKIIATVHDEFYRSNVPPIFSRKGDGIRVESEVKITGADRKLMWLSSSVRPTVEYLFACGRGKDALKALGLWADEVSD